MINFILGGRQHRTTPAGQILGGRDPCNPCGVDAYVTSGEMSVGQVNGSMWELGDALCDTWVALDVGCCTASILNLAAISVDRCALNPSAVPIIIIIIIIIIIHIFRVA